MPGYPTSSHGSPARSAVNGERMSDPILIPLMPMPEGLQIPLAAYLNPMPPPRLFEPCIPTRATQVPTGPDWIHEIKHDGYPRILQRQDKRVRLLHPVMGTASLLAIP